MPMTHRTLFPPPDENRALEQLERLHREIQRARRDRERAGSEFDGFVDELRTGAGQAQAAPGESAARRPMRPVAPAARTPVAVPPPIPAADAAGAFASEPQPQSRTVAGEPAATVPAPTASPQGLRQRILLPVAATVLIGGLAFVYFWQRTHAPSTSQPPPTASSNRETAVRPAAAPPAREARPAPAAPATPVVSPSTVQLTTARAVWMRVTVDGQRALEREVPAGQHLTYTPANSIVIRAGDGGAVRVKVGNGPEETFGRDAFPLTRSFTPK
jgi:hypothetical protein